MRAGFSLSKEEKERKDQYEGESIRLEVELPTGQTWDDLSTRINNDSVEL